MDTRIYLLPVDETHLYLINKYGADEEKTNDYILYVDSEMTEKECEEIVKNSEDPLADAYSPQQFQAQFNFALEYAEISSNTYLIKIFQ